VVFNSVHIVCVSIVLIAPMLILGAIVISDIGLVNILSDQGNGSRRREHFAEYGVPRFSDTGAGLA
jgi:hypothetical protein